ncbi:recombinase family protein [Bacillus cereus]
MKKVALYIRVSTQEQVENGYSIEAQDYVLKEYCKANSLNIFQVYVDEGITGTSIDKRIALQNLLNDAKKQRFQELIVWKVNRLARNLVELLNTVEQLKLNGVSFRSVSEKFETNTPLGQFTLTMMGAVGQLERETIIENTRLGKEHRNQQGWYCGTKILGYDVIPKKICINEGLASNLKVNQQESLLVNEIFQLYASGMGYKAITSSLNKREIKSKTGKQFSVGVVAAILKNIVYIGKTRCTIDGLPKEIKGLHKSIISQELWEQVQVRLKSHKLCEKNHNKIFELTPFLKCPICNSSMIGSNVVSKRKDGTNRINSYYTCSNYTNKGIKVCRPMSVPAQLIEEQVHMFLVNYIQNPSIVNDIFNRINQPSKYEIEKADDLNTLNSENEQLRKQKKQLFLDFERGSIDEINFVQQINQINKDMDKIQSEIYSLEEKVQGVKKKNISKKIIQRVINQLPTIIKNSNIHEKRKLLSSLINKIMLSTQRNLSEVVLKIDEHIIPITINLEEDKKWRIL